MMIVAVQHEPCMQGQRKFPLLPMLIESINHTGITMPANLGSNFYFFKGFMHCKTNIVSAGFFESRQEGRPKLV